MLRQVADLKRQVDKLRTKQGEGNAKAAGQLEEATKKLQHKEAKLTGKLKCIMRRNMLAGTRTLTVPSITPQHEL